MKVSLKLALPTVISLVSSYKVLPSSTGYRTTELAQARTADASNQVRSCRCPTCHNSSMPTSPKYLIPSTGKRVTLSQLKRLKKEFQIEAMRQWFDNNYDAPDELPYDSSEGGYQWIWGGPYEAEEAPGETPQQVWLPCRARSAGIALGELRGVPAEILSRKASLGNAGKWKGWKR